MKVEDFMAFMNREPITEFSDELLAGIAEKIADGERMGRVGDRVFFVDLDAFGNFLPAIASYVAKGQMQGSLLGKDWSVRVVAAEVPPTLREQAEAKVREVVPEAENSTLWEFMVENVRNLLENDGAKIVTHELSETEEETVRLARQLQEERD